MCIADELPKSYEKWRICFMVTKKVISKEIYFNYNLIT